MPWVRVGDTAATYPKLLQIAGYPGADDRAVNEVFGWLYRCATQSAAHLTDYVIDAGTAHMVGGARTATLIRWCTRAGLLTPTKISGASAWVLLNDPAFIHIRTKAELEWEAQRKADTSNTHLTVPVRRRDGDQCRYCGIGVQWSGPKTNRSAEYDHRYPGTAATVDTLVVACRSCNGARKNDPDWDLAHPLRRAPARPAYGKVTAAFLTRNGHPTDPNYDPDALINRSTTHAAEPGDAATGAHPTQARPGARPQDVTTTPAGTAADRADAATGAQHGPGATPPPTWATEPAHGPPRARESPPESPPSHPTIDELHSEESGFSGSGRDGTDREAHQGTQVTPPPPPPTDTPVRPPRRRGSRGSRRPPTPPEGHPHP